MRRRNNIAKIKKKPGAERRPLLVRGRYCLKNIQKKNYNKNSIQLKYIYSLQQQFVKFRPITADIRS